MKKWRLAFSSALVAGLLGAESADAGDRYRHGGRHRARRGTGMPLAFRHQPYHPFSRHYAYHPHRYRPYRGYYYWPFGYSRWAVPDCRIARQGPCPENPPAAPAQEVANPGAAPEAEHGRGWNLFGEGHPADAMQVFVDESANDVFFDQLDLGHFV